LLAKQLTTWIFASILISMNRLPTSKQVQIVAALVEGNSLRSTTRMTGVSINTVTKLLVDLGQACKVYQDHEMRNLPCTRIQVDEIWSFCYAKQKNLPEDLRGVFGFGDVWTWTAICADTKLVPSWHVGWRNAEEAAVFINDLAGRLAQRVQLSSDGHKPYLKAVENAFGADIDYAIIQKLYGSDPNAEKRYSPAVCTGVTKQVVTGNPVDEDISTSYVERQNLTMRMCMRRFTRLTNGFSKKVANHEAAIALHFMHYNFSRIHKTLRVTPAMEAGISDHVWSLEELVGLIR